MNIYQRGKNWYIDFTFHGKRIREMIGPSRKGAGKVIAKKKAEIAENKFLDVRKDPDPVKFYNFCKEYLEWSKTNKKETTFRGDLHIARRLNEEFEGKTIQEITTWQIEKWKNRRKEKVKPASVNRELAFLKHFYTKAIDAGKCKENPAKKVKLLKGEVKRVRFLMPKEVQILLSNCPDDLRPLVIMAVHTGMRKGELLGLQWVQINFEQGIISILDTKNGERRDISMDETVKGLLKSMEKKGDYVFSNQDGSQLKAIVIHKAFRPVVKESKIEDFRWHDLRHTFASNLVMNGIDIMTVKELMGHKDLKMTLRYSHLAPQHKTRAVNILDRVLSLAPPQEEAGAKVVSIRG